MRVWGRVAESPMIISVKKIPIDSTCAEFWNVWFMPPPAPRCSGGRLFITPARFGEANAPIERPSRSRIAANSPVGEVDRQLLEQAEGDRRDEHPAGREGRGAVAVGQVAGDRPGDQEAERQRQHVGCPAQSGVDVKL